MESLQRKFASIHLTLAQQQEQASGAQPGTTKPTGPPPDPLRMSALNPMRSPDNLSTPPAKVGVSAAPERYVLIPPPAQVVHKRSEPDALAWEPFHAVCQGGVPLSCISPCFPAISDACACEMQ